MGDIQVITNENGLVDKAYYKNAILDIIDRFIQERGYDTKHITANHLNACLTQCKHTLFESNETYISNTYTNPIFYTNANIEILYQIYLEVCEMYICIPSLYGFSRLTGIQEDTTQEYLTSASLETLKHRREYIQNKLADSTLGVTVLANNDSSVGLMYTAKNQIRQETIKQISMDNLPKLGAK